jgi:S1-C subfamily serine protease
MKNYTQQDLHKAIWIKQGMAQQDVTLLMGKPIKVENEANLTSLHYCRTGGPVDHFRVVILKDELVDTVHKYQVSGEEVHGATGDCSLFVVPMSNNLGKYEMIVPNNRYKKENNHPKSIATGTGFFISNDGYILTNSHVIEDSSELSVIINGKRVNATLVDHDKSNDIALLKIEGASKGLPIEFKYKAKKGTEIGVLGYPNIGLQGNEKKATFGFINSNSGIQGDTRYFQISSPIQPGSSGSPMVNERGVVIGIASASLNQSAAIKATGTLAQNVNYAIKITYSLPMLINHGVNYIEPVHQKALPKTELIESISDSVVLVVAE